MELNWWDFFQAECEKLGLVLSNEQMKQFQTFYQYLTEKNQVMNLTAITELSEVIKKHFLDSLSLVHLLRPDKKTRVLDLGTGAGFPGIPLKIMFPETPVTLVDSLNKRVVFLNEVIRLCHLEGIWALHGRAEDLGRDRNHREQYDLCLSRAVAPLPSLCEYCLPFVKVDGSFVAYKSIHIDDEVEEAKDAIRLLGGRLTGRESFALVGGEAERTLLQIKKEKPTPAKYPRKAGTPRKDPL